MWAQSDHTETGINGLLIFNLLECVLPEYHVIFQLSNN
jgi:hypothetical protein